MLIRVYTPKRKTLKQLVEILTWFDRDPSKIYSFLKSEEFEHFEKDIEMNLNIEEIITLLKILKALRTLSNNYYHQCVRLLTTSQIFQELKHRIVLILLKEIIDKKIRIVEE